MNVTKKRLRNILSFVLAFLVLFSTVNLFDFSAVENSKTNISYVFSGANASDSGYAEGTLSFTAENNGTYYLYWADDTKALDGYYEIESFNISDGKSQTFEFGDHTAIPVGATKIIAVTNKSDLSVSNAVAVYSLPDNKQLKKEDNNLLYTFNSYSDVHIDETGYYKNDTKNWKQALKYAVDKNTDFIVSSGDMTSSTGGPDQDWVVYEQILADSNYVNPIWESDGNHDLYCGAEVGLSSFVKASGTDNTIANYDANKPYYYMTEKNTGDMFIFMALESHKNPSSCDEFSDEQLAWLENLLNTYYGKGINIYLIQHSPIKGFGAGDRMDKPYYKALLSESYESTVRFKRILQKYPKLIWMSGHTHEDYSMGYNYSNENGTACHMIHNSAVVGSTWASPTDTSLDYNDGAGYNSQGYYVEVYNNQVIYYGANLTDEKIYPEYCYIMDGSRNTTPDQTNPTEVATTQKPTEATWNTGSTLPNETVTKRVYFANTVKWQFVDCYSWSDDDTKTCIWPGYGATYYGTNEEGIDLYYCDIPEGHEKIIWNNAGNNSKTSDIVLDGENNFFIPKSTTSSSVIQVDATVWKYETTEPSSATETSTTKPQETTTTLPQTSTTETVTTPTPITYEYGDVNMDGSINVSDATLIQKAVVMLVNLSEQQINLADVDGDGLVSIKDATLIQKFATSIIAKFPVSNSADIENNISLMSIDNENDLTYGEMLDNARTELDGLYQFSSYDQYQNLKKFYYTYKSVSSVDNESEVINKYLDLSNELNTIAKHIGFVTFYPIGDTYYFENTYNWSVVNCYAWKGSSKNASWPGVAIEKVGKNNGHDVYGVKFESAGQYKQVIFNTGTDQTVDIDLSKYQYNCFALSGKGSSTDLGVSNFNYTSNVNPTTPTTIPIDDSKHYALLYHDGGNHKWTNIDTFFEKQSDGTYKLDYTVSGTQSISCNVYDNKESTYNCVESSTKLNFESGVKTSYNLISSTTRGKSLTISSLTDGDIISFIYNPAENIINVECKGTSTTTTTVNNTIPSTTISSDDVIYTLYIAPTKSLIDDGDIFKANIKDSTGKYHTYTFTQTDRTYNGVTVYKTEITNPSYTDIVKIQYQTKSNNNDFLGQIVNEKSTTLSYYNNTIMVFSSMTSGSLSQFE